jgi:hypothetical protein
VRIDGVPGSPASYPMIGVGDASAPLSGWYIGGDANGWSYYPANAEKYSDSAAGNFGPYGGTAGVGQTISVALDVDGGTLTFYVDGNSQGTAFSPTSPRACRSIP